MKLPKELKKIRDDIVCNMYEKGYKVRDIALKNNISQWTVYDIIKRHGLVEGRSNSTEDRRKETVEVDMSIDYKKHKQLRNELIYKLRTIDKRPLKEIGKIFNIHYSVVSTVVRDYNKPKNKTGRWIKCIDQNQ